MVFRKVILCGAILWAGAVPAKLVASDWLLAPSYYSHDPQSGERTPQFTEPEPAYVYENPTYLKSGYHHRRSTLRMPDGSLDQFHVVEEWGRPVRPYGEWEHPFRPYSVPYHLWGEPFGGLGPIYQNFSPWSGGYPGPIPPIHHPGHKPGHPGHHSGHNPGQKPGHNPGYGQKW